MIRRLRARPRLGLVVPLVAAMLLGAGGTITLHQKVRPYDALAAFTLAPGSITGHYHYLGTYK